MKNKIEDLRNHLFATLEALQDEEKPMELDRARAVADVAQVLINSVKVEVDFMRATGAITAPSGFLTDTTRPQLRKVD
jgi:hypothetical protein